jgi:hypothetical protein
MFFHQGERLPPPSTNTYAITNRVTVLYSSKYITVTHQNKTLKAGDFT